MTELGRTVAAGDRHPLPWAMPDRDGFVNLEPALVLHEGEPKPFKLALGFSGPGSRRMSSVFTRAELEMLRDQIDAALAAPFLVRVLGGPVAQRWMVASIEHRLDEVLGFHPNLALAHAGRPGSVDDVVEAWARQRGVHSYVDPAGPENGGNAVMIFMTTTEEEHQAWRESCGQIPAWWIRPSREADRTPI
ncbi:hypothetical protein [Micromonospora chalcea]|uniref:hypothetical protein n=1 Tax=Micromonospora chalcea TaxID=1874 RepID=UPI003D74A17E